MLPPETSDIRSGDRLQDFGRRGLRTGLAFASLLAVAAWSFFLANRTPGDRSALVGFPLDDAWIHLVYARSLVTEGGLHFNAGVPEAGMTSPLWVIFAASVHLVAAPFGTAAVVISTKLLALGFGIGSIWALHALARALGLAAWAALLVATLAAVDPAMTFSRAAGMEVPLFTLLVLLALASAARGELVPAGVATGLVLVARPEGALVVPGGALLALLALRGRAGSVGSVGRRVSVALASAALPSLLYAAFCLWATGRPLPNTFYAKFRGAGVSALDNVALGWRDYVHGAEPYFTLEIGTLLAVVGTVALFARQRGRAAAVLGAGILLFCGTLASRGFSAGHFHYRERWLIPAYPFLLLAIGAGVEAIVGRFERAAPGSRSPRWALAAGTAAVALLVARVPPALGARASEYAWNCRNIEEMNVALGRWVAANVPPDDAIAVIDAGAMRYFGQRETVDLFGLNDHRIRVEKGVEAQVAYLRSRGVEWLVLVPARAAGIIEALALEPVHEVFAPRYTISKAPQDRFVVYRWSRRAAPV